MASPKSKSFHSNKTSSFASSTASNFVSRQVTSPSTSSMRSNSNDRNQFSSPSLRFSLDPRISPSRSISMKATCTCSTTTHPGSFRCAFHRKASLKNNSGKNKGAVKTALFHSSSLNLRSSAMKNSLVRICGVEGELVKRTLSNLIRPSSNQLRRRAAFEPKPSRLSVMFTAEDL